VSEIVMEQRIQATPADVYAYLTDEARWKRWQGSDATLDPRVGGVFSILMANGLNARGEFVELVPDRRVVFTWGWVGYENLPPGSSTVEIDLRADGDATILVLTHGSLPDEELPPQRMGWTHYLPRLAVAAAGGEPGEDTGPSSGI
jgi:uncharacterized protein YndB with AHSA1/START domain